MPEPLSEDEVNRMVLQLLTLRPDPPLPEQSPLDARRGAAVVEAMDPIGEWHEAWPGAAHPFEATVLAPVGDDVFRVPDFPTGYGDAAENERYRGRREVMRSVLKDVAPEVAADDRLLDELLRDYTNESLATEQDVEDTLSRAGGR